MNGLPDGVLIVFFLIVTLSHVLEGITGFGSTALSLPLLAALMGIALVKPVLMLYVILLCVYILAKSRKAVDWRHYGKMICMMALGVPIGILLYARLPEKPLLGILAAFTVIVSARGLVRAFGFFDKSGGKTGQSPKMKRLPALALVWLGGVIHGAFASGGPLVIIYAAENIESKGGFRATMCMIWLTVNTIMIAQMGWRGELTGQMWNLFLWGLPFLALGTYLGDRLHGKINETVFLRLTYGVLLVSGILTAINLF